MLKFAYVKDMILEQGKAGFAKTHPPARPLQICMLD
jgi:hypothetical protein